MNDKMNKIKKLLKIFNYDNYEYQTLLLIYFKEKRVENFSIIIEPHIRLKKYSSCSI